jgi:8-amino-7-oxononanoate synthase
MEQGDRAAARRLRAPHLSSNLIYQLNDVSIAHPMQQYTDTIRERINRYTVPAEIKHLGLYLYFRPLSSGQDTEVQMNGQKLLMLGSNNYLGLSTHPKVKEAAIAAIAKYGTGCAGSRFLNGTLDIHLECEEKLARFVGKEAALVYSTGFQVNLGVLPALASRSDFLILDKLDHASIVDGARMSFSRVIRYRHNDMQNLEEILRSLPPEKSKLIVVDGVFSMDGDLADLPAIVALAEAHGGVVMVDDAHGLGVIGPQGRGTAAHFGLTDRIDLTMGTFSKSLASVGGFIASDAETIEYLKHQSRSLIFSASIPPANVATVMAALEIVLSEPERIQRLWDNAHRLSAGLKAMGFDLGRSCTPILPVCIGDDRLCFKFCRLLQDEGIFVNPVVTPGVEPGNALLRVSLMATHTFAQIDFALEKFEKVGRQTGLVH